MIRNARNRMIERFTGGDLSPAERKRFVEKMASDPGTRRLAEADRAIVDGIGKERAALPAGASEPGAHLLARLAATPPPSLSGSRTGAGAGIGGGFMGMMIALAALIGLVVGTFLIAPLFQHQRPSAAHAIETPAHDLRPVPAPRDARREMTEEPAPEARAAEPAAVRRETPSPATRTVTRTPKDLPVTEKAPVVAAQPEGQPTVARPSQSIRHDEEDDGAPLPVISSDSVHVRMSIRR